MRGQFAEKMLTMVTNAHLWHFYTKSFAAHGAFGGFYTALQGLADKYVEADIGAHGPIKPSSDTFYYLGLGSSVSSIRSFKQSVKVMRDAQESTGQNGLVATLEEIMTLIDQTLFKIEQLS